MWGRCVTNLVAVIVVICLFGAVDELTQPVVGRVCDLIDWLYNVSGTVFGCLLYAVLARIFQSAKDKKSPPSKDASG